MCPGHLSVFVLIRIPVAVPYPPHPKSIICMNEYVLAKTNLCSSVTSYDFRSFSYERCLHIGQETNLVVASIIAAFLNHKIEQPVNTIFHCLTINYLTIVFMTIF